MMSVMKVHTNAVCDERISTDASGAAEVEPDKCRLQTVSRTLRYRTDYEFAL